MEFRNFFYTDVQGKECKIIYTGTFEKEEPMITNPSSPWCGPGCDEERYVDNITLVTLDFDKIHEDDQMEISIEAYNHFDEFIDEMIIAAHEAKIA